VVKLESLKENTKGLILVIKFEFGGSFGMSLEGGHFLFGIVSHL
jgi:hypothetical protein